jgi:hypothetical protein
MKTAVALLVFALSVFPLQAAQVKSTWRAATPGELQSAIPPRALVQNERIETEARTASGIISQRGKMIAGVVLITAGYSADGKYSHYLLVQSPIRIGDVSMVAGTYVLGWKRVEAGLDVHFYDAITGAEIGSGIAKQMPPNLRVESFRIWPPGERSTLQIGRFELPYKLPENQ